MKHKNTAIKMFAISTVMFTALVSQAHALTITDGLNDKFLVTSIPISTKVNTTLKLSFENKTSGTNLSLCAGSAVDFNAKKCATSISGSGGPGFMFLTIVDTKTLAGKHLYVINNGPAKSANFSLTVE